MRFNDADIRPNRTIPLAEVRAGATSDVRWRSVLDGPVEEGKLFTADALDVMDCEERQR